MRMFTYPYTDPAFIQRYAIHLMWLNRTKDDKQKYIYPCSSEEALVTELLTPAIKWGKANPEAPVYLWYDSMHTSSQAVEDTQCVLSQLSSKTNVHNVQLRNVREIPMVGNNPDIFSDQIPLYFRIDLLKAILVVDSIEREGNDSALYSDLQVGDLRPDHDRMDKQDLFSKEIMLKFKHAGLILNYNPPAIAENQFLHLVKDPIMIDAIKHVVINTNFARVLTALNDFEKIGADKVILLANLNETVFKTMIDDLYSYYRARVRGDKILVMDNEENTPIDEYDFKRDGYAPFGLAVSRGGTSFIGKCIAYPPLSGRIEVRPVDVRSGRGHGVDNIKNLILRPPANGKAYTCTFCELSEETPKPSLG